MHLSPKWTRTDNAFRQSLKLDYNPPERVKTLCSVQPHQEGEKTPVSTKSLSVSTQRRQNIQQLYEGPPIGGRLKGFVHQWVLLGAHQHQINIISDGYSLPFRTRPVLSRHPVIISGYRDDSKDHALYSSIQDLLRKGAIEKVNISESLGFYSRLFLVPKPGNRWRPVIDLSSLNKYLEIPRFKMETPESIRASLRKGEWITSIDLTDAYLRIPIHRSSQKFLRFHHRGVTYQFTSLPFGLATAPLIFTALAKEVKLLALKQHMRIHQYLDDWLLRAPTQQEALSQTDSLLKLVTQLGFIVNYKKSELTPTQRFDFIGYHFMLDLALVKPTQDRWVKLQTTFRATSQKSALTARTLMSVIGLLASTEKTVKLGRIHMRPFQWHLKVHWKYPMPLNSTIQ